MTRVVEPEPVTIDPQHAEIVAHLERSFREQARAAAWADVREAELREFFHTRQEAEGSRLSSIDCRASLCRMRVVHEDDQALSRFMTAVGLRPPFATAGARFPDPDADHSLLFLAREGVRLPWPTAAELASTGAC